MNFDLNFSETALSFCIMTPYHRLRAHFISTYPQGRLCLFRPEITYLADRLLKTNHSFTCASALADLAQVIAAFRIVAFVHGQEI